MGTVKENMRKEKHAAMNATVTPIWKHRALEDIAQRELRKVCEDLMKEQWDTLRVQNEQEQKEMMKKVCLELVQNETMTQVQPILNEVAQLKANLGLGEEGKAYASMRDKVD